MRRPSGVSVGVKDTVRRKAQTGAAAAHGFEQHEIRGRVRAVADKLKPLRLERALAQAADEVRQPLRLVDQKKPPAGAQQARRGAAQL